MFFFRPEFPHLNLAIANSVSYQCYPALTNSVPLNGGRKTKFKFKNCYSLGAAETLSKKYGSDKVGVLNMFVPSPFSLIPDITHNCHFMKFQGRATSRQEEVIWWLRTRGILYRRSTLYSHISYTEEYYTMHPEGGIWSPGVRVFRKSDGDDNKTLDLENQFEVGVISVAAIKNPSVVFTFPFSDSGAGFLFFAMEERRDFTPEGDFANQQDLELTSRKVHILRIHEVLEAFGCGGTHNN